jgi:hypothetical protein
MDRQNAARRGDLDSIVELLRSDPWFDSGSWLAKGIAGIKPTAFGDRVSMGPANIEPREMKRWIEMGWLEPASDDAIRVNLLMPGQAITMMALKLHEADQRISLQGGNNVDPTTRFMLLAIAQNHKFDMGFITKFFSSDPAIRGWENLLSRSNRKQLKGMLENILWLQEQGWALPAGVDLRRYWQETLGDAVQAKDSDLYDELENMLK